MARKKVKLEFIVNDSVRRTTFRKRKANLLKKASELKTLCGIVACAIIYSTYDTKPDVWPSPAEAHHVLEMFNNLPSVKEGKHSMNQEGYLKKNISKLTENLKKERKKNRALEMKLLKTKCLELNDLTNLEDLKELRCLFDEKIKQVTEMIELIETSIFTQGITGKEIEVSP